MAKEIGSTTDSVDFSDVRVPSIDPGAQAGVDAALAALDASYAPLMESVRQANEAKDALLSWAALAEKVLNMVMPIIQRELDAHNVPKAEHPKRWQTALPGLLNIATLPEAQRPNALAALLASLV